MFTNPFYPTYQGDPARIGLEEMESYCAVHPDSPSAMQRPALSIRSELWIALLGPSMEKGIVGIGYTVESALRAFDTQYMARDNARRVNQVKAGQGGNNGQRFGPIQKCK